jgi:NAD(P)-dependent dehydrogenase (short-subunit alcohol dehydrogenase family)
MSVPADDGLPGEDSRDEAWFRDSLCRARCQQRRWPAGSKAVLHAYARVWLSELKDRRIRVNVLTPGQVVTPGQEQMLDDETKAREALIPRGKNGSPEEIATVALFLASDDSSYVNGMELIADGGTTAV